MPEDLRRSEDYAEVGSVIIMIAVTMMTATVPVIVVAMAIPMSTGMIVPMTMMAASPMAPTTMIAPTAIAIAVPRDSRSWESQSRGQNRNER